MTERRPDPAAQPVDRRWATRLWIVRHGESLGNVAWRNAEAAGHHLIDVSPRDADVPLSPLGERQAQALGRWFAASPPDERPTVVFSSPYLRAFQTAQHLLAASGSKEVPCLVDERLREKEFGAVNRLTKAGIMATFPAEVELRKAIGKFYYRPPGGESWCDIILRLRSFWSTLREDHPGERVLIVCHSVVTLCMRYLIERLSEEEVLAIDATSDVANCALTSYVNLQLERYNFVAPLEEAGETVTRAPDAPLPK